MIRGAILVGLVSLSINGNAVLAQPAPPANIQNIPAELKSLNWQSVHLSALTPRQRCQALLLLNDKLASISSVAASQADLMSMYIDQQNLGGQFAAQPPISAAKQLTFADAMKVAVAMIQGPMSGSSYATAFKDSTADTLAAYEQMYEATCQRRWSETAESRTQMRSMAAFLNKQGKLQDYQTWAGAEAAKRQQQYEQAMAQRRASEQAGQSQQATDQRMADAKEERLRAENIQLQQALAAAQQQQRQQAEQNQQQQQQQQANSAVAPPPAVVEPAYYGGAYYGYGTPAYYGTNNVWAEDVASEGLARAETNQRISSWHGVSGGARRPYR